MANHNKEKHGGSRFIYKDGSWKCAWIFKCTICSKELTSNPENHVRSAHDTWIHEQEDGNLNQDLITNDKNKATKGQLISECLFDFFKFTKKPTKTLTNFCPRI